MKDSRLDLGRYVKNPFNRRGQVPKRLDFNDLFVSKARDGEYPWNPSRFSEVDLLKKYQTRKQTLKQIDQITQMQKETRRMMAEIEDAPIEIKIQHLVDSFNEVYEDSPPELRPPRVDRKRVEEIIHRLGFEGKGME